MEDDMAKNEDLQDAGAAAGIAALVVALVTVLNQSRSVILQVDNQTDSTMKKISEHHVHGEFSEGPDDIPPHTASLFSSQSVPGSVETGTEGSCSYLVDGVQIDVFWDNPAFGSNNSDAKYAGENEVRYRVEHSAGGGNTG